MKYTNITPDGEQEVTMDKPTLSREEKRAAIKKYCAEHNACHECPLRKILRDGENCYSSDPDPECNAKIDRNYEILFGDKLDEFAKAERTERERILDTAKEYVCRDRNNQYGSPEDSFKVIADLWAGYLGAKITARDVAAMMVLFKMARVRTGAGKADNWIDAAGYCACGGDIEAVKQVTNPCVKCKRKPNCPTPCYPKRDFVRGNKGRKKK